MLCEKVTFICIASKYLCIPSSLNLPLIRLSINIHVLYENYSYLSNTSSESLGKYLTFYNQLTSNMFIISTQLIASLSYACVTLIHLILTLNSLIRVLWKKCLSLCFQSLSLLEHENGNLEIRQKLK